MANIIESWEALNASRRMGLVLGFLIIAAISIASIFWLTDKDYQVLFSDLEGRDAAKVVSELQSLKVDYRLENQGTQIVVPASEVHDVRLQLVSSGLPLSGGVGFEIFDESDFGMTDFAQRVNYQRALEGELTRTIMALKEVKYARVHLVLPERGLFQQDDSPPSASVTLFLKQEYLQADNRPSAMQIEGIQRLLSASVPGLQSGQVTVSDQAGVTLSRQMPEQGSMVAISARLQQKQAVEQYLTDKVNQVLIHTFGPGQAMVSVDVSLNFSETKRTLENVVTANGDNDGIVRRRETRVSSGAQAKGTAGNVTTEVEYKLGRTIEQIVETPGEIKRLSVGIMIPAEVSSERRQEIQSLVQMAVGLNQARGDELAVYTIDASVETPLAMETLVLSNSIAAQSPGIPPMQVNSNDNILLQTIQRQPVASGAAGAVLMMLLLFGLLRLITGSRTDHSVNRALTDEEREQVLLRLTGWLESNEDPRSEELL